MRPILRPGPRVLRRRLKGSGSRAGSCGGLYQASGHPGAPHLTVMCPRPASAWADGQRQGIQLTVTVPGRHGWPLRQRSGKLHHSRQSMSSID